MHHRLAPGVRRALEDGVINLGQAKAFTVGEKDAQTALVGQVTAHPGGYRAPDIRRMLLERTIPLSRAIFAPALYKGGFVKDLFEDETHACDAAEFRRLQIEACQAKRAELEKTWAWVELTIGGYVPVWAYARDQPPATGGAIVHLRDDLRVEIHTGLGKRSSPGADIGAPGVAARADRLGADAGPAPGGTEAPRGPLTRAHLVWARQEKSRRLQLAIADNPAVATSLAILGLLNSAAEVHICGAVGWMAPDDRFAHPALEQLTAERLAKGRIYGLRKGVEMFGRLMRMPGAQRLALFAALVAPHFASWPGEIPDLGDTPLVVAAAAELGLTGVDDAELFTPTAAYLEQMPRAQLLRVAGACGVTVDPGMKKAELVDTILLSIDRDPAWYPPELTFASKPEILAAIAAPRDKPAGQGPTPEKAARPEAAE